MSARTKALTLGLLAAVAIWLLALVSYAQGNPSAVSALVGVPIGAIFGSAIIWVALL